MAFIKAIDDDDPWVVAGVKGRFIEDGKDRRNEQSLRLIPKRQGED